MINLKRLREINSKIRLMNICYEGALLNVDTEIALLSSEYAIGFVRAHKMYKQSKNIIDKLSSIQKCVVDFHAENFDAYIDEHNKWYSDIEESCTFDPYTHLRYIFESESIYDLPKDISQYKELHEFSMRFSDMDKMMFAGFDQVFGNLEKRVPYIDEDGNYRSIPESELSEEQRESRKIISELSGIEADHAYDYYDKWYETMSRMIEERAEFIDMLNLIKI